MRSLGFQQDSIEIRFHEMRNNSNLCNSQTSEESLCNQNFSIFVQYRTNDENSSFNLSILHTWQASIRRKNEWGTFGIWETSSRCLLVFYNFFYMSSATVKCVTVETERVKISRKTTFWWKHFARTRHRWRKKSRKCSNVQKIQAFKVYRLLDGRKIK